MEIYPQNPSDPPVPPQEVRIRQFQVKPWRDGRRVSVFLELTPFQQDPSGEISVIDNNGNEVANLTIIETTDTRNEFTIHLSSSATKGKYTALLNIFYPEPSQDDKPNQRAPDDYLQSPTTRFMVVDRAQSTFVFET